MKYLLVIYAICCFQLVKSQISIDGVRCGVRTCSFNEYCSKFDKTCQPCTDICNSSHHNYEKKTCEDDCQNYLHDIRYGKNGEGTGNDLRKTVQQLSRMVTVTLSIVCLMLVVLTGVLCFQLYRWKVKKNITLQSLKNKFLKRKSADNNAAPKSNNPEPNNEGKKPDLRLEMPSSRTNSDVSPITMTTSISRRPAEDSTLDYAYDNPAMSSPR